MVSELPATPDALAYFETIPVEQCVIGSWNVFACWKGFSAGALRIQPVARPPEASTPLARFEQHAVAAGTWRPVRNAVLHGMHINAWPVLPGDAFCPCSFNDFIDGKIFPIGMFPVQQRCGNPNFVGDLDVVNRLRHTIFL